MNYLIPRLTTESFPHGFLRQSRRFGLAFSLSSLRSCLIPDEVGVDFLNRVENTQKCLQNLTEGEHVVPLQNTQ